MKCRPGQCRTRRPLDSDPDRLSLEIRRCGGPDLKAFANAGACCLRPEIPTKTGDDALVLKQCTVPLEFVRVLESNVPDTFEFDEQNMTRGAGTSQLNLW